MLTEPFTLRTNVSRHGNGTTTATVSGDIDSASADAWEALLNGWVADGCAELILDLAEVTFFGAAGAHVLERLADALQASGSTLMVVRPTRTARIVLEVCGLEWIIDPTQR